MKMVFILSLLTSTAFASHVEYKCQLINKTNNTVIKEIYALDVKGERRAFTFSKNTKGLPAAHRVALIEISKSAPRCLCDYKFQYRLSATIGADLLVSQSSSDNYTFFDVVDEEPAERLQSNAQKDTIPTLLQAESENYKVVCEQEA